MRWDFDGEIELVNPETKTKELVYITASGNAGGDGEIEVNDMQAYDENGLERDLEFWQEDEIIESLSSNDGLYQQAYERAIDDAYDRFHDR